MDTDDNRTTPDAASARFGAAVDGGMVPVDGADAELARELEIVRRLKAQGAALDPDPETRERARRRLLAALTREAAQEAPTNGPSRAS